MSIVKGKGAGVFPIFKEICLSAEPVWLLRLWPDQLLEDFGGIADLPLQRKQPS